MEELFNKMLEYTKMTEELPFPEFSSYYQDLMAFLQNDYQDLNTENLIKVKGILAIISINAMTRAANKDDNRKKFQKMAEKSNFWQEAIKTRLVKDGLTPQEIDAKTAALWDEEETA